MPCAFSRGASKWRRCGWLVLAMFFTYMTVDDGSMVHERLGTAYDVKVLSGDSMFDAFPSYAWQIAVLPGFIVLGLFTFFFLLRELRTTRAKVLLFLALSTLAFAVGLDFIEGLERDDPLNVYAHPAERYDFEEWTRSRFHHSEYTTLVHFSKSVEETLEMMAMSVIWFVFLQHLLGSTDALVVRFRRRAPVSSKVESADDKRTTQDVDKVSSLADPLVEERRAGPEVAKPSESQSPS